MYQPHDLASHWKHLSGRKREMFSMMHCLFQAFPATKLEAGELQGEHHDACWNDTVEISASYSLVPEVSSNR